MGYNYQKELDHKRTVLGLIDRIYWQQTSNSKVRGHNIPAYTKDDFRKWVLNQKDFVKIYTKWILSKFNKKMRPSIDRLNDNIGYNFKNIQLITWKKNNEKSHKDMRSGKIRTKDKPQVAVIGFNIITGEEKEFISMAEASRYTGINPGHISEFCNGKRKTTGNFIWRIK